MRSEPPASGQFGAIAASPLLSPMKIPTLVTTFLFAATVRVSLAQEPKSAPAEHLHIVAVGAHPDDVAVGAGGVIASYVKRGHRATILNVTFGETVRPPGPKQEEAKLI